MVVAKNRRVERKQHRAGLWLIAVTLLCVLLWGAEALALPKIDVSIGGGDATGPAQVSSALKILGALTVLSLAPAIIMLMTCFTRIVIVLSFAKQALGVQGMPPTQVMTGLALLLTAFIMTPIAKEMNEKGLAPYMAGKIAEKEAFSRGMKPLRDFMLDHTRTKDLELFINLTHSSAPKSRDDLSLTVIIPAFVLSELTAAFHMGVLVFIPFVLLDFIVGSVLMSMGMVMLPPALVALPLKVMLFVIVDGWHLIIMSLVRSVGT